MKWSVIGLFALGVVASVSAFLLVVALVGRDEQRSTTVAPSDQAPVRGDVRVLVAARDLDPRTVLGGDGVLARTMSVDEAPPAYYSDPAQVIGKILVVPLKQGQLFEQSSFASEGSGLRLSSALTQGKRIVSVALDDSMRIEPLLYPGCMVDVLATIDLQSLDSSSSVPVSVTLLQGVMVLAVGDRTVVSDQPTSPSGLGDTGGRPTVSLLVEPAQAELLKLAMEKGSISLALRNPMDAEAVAAEGTSVSQISPLVWQFEERRNERVRSEQRSQEEQREHERTKRALELEQSRYESERARQEFEVARMKLEKERLDAERQLEAATAGRPENEWKTTILRGSQTETRTFALNTSGKGGG